MTSLIMLIDDSVCTRTILEKTLRRERYTTMGFDDGYTALRWLVSEEARIPDLIILDLKMPKMDGYTTLLHLRKRAATASTPVIILSGRAGVIDRLKGRLAGASVYLTKPFKPQTVLAAVREQLPNDDHS
jgi:twitching motility two-component system response regulator PilG